MKERPQEFAFKCPAEQISSYIDGELLPEHELALENHIASCQICRDELNREKGFLIALSDTLERAGEIELPKDFTKSIVVHAESRVSGLRDRRERTAAIVIAGVMLLLIVVAFGGSIAGVFAPAETATEKAGTVFGVAAEIVFDLTRGVSAFLRSFLSTQTFSGLLAYIALSLVAAAAIYFVTRSLRRFFRTQGSE